MDESELYDRQIRLWGSEAQKRIQSSRVLVYGAGGLGAEICKNLCLAGISLTWVDSEITQAQDLASNFFLDVSDIGENRSLASLPRLRELNKYVTIEGCAESLDNLNDDFFIQHNLVILTKASLSHQIRIDKLCRSKGIAFYAADVFGLEGILFVDLGVHVYRTESGSGAAAKLSDEIEATYPSLEEAYAIPFTRLSNRRFGPVSPIFVKYRILAEFRQSKGRPASSEDMSDIILIGNQIISANGISSETDSKTFPFSENDALNLTLTSQAEIAPVCAILGGVIGQEVVKYVSAKGAPIENFFVLSALSGEGKMFRSPPL